MTPSDPPMAQTGREKVAAYAWYALGVLVLANLISAVDRFMMGIIIIPLKTSLHLSDTQLGILSGVGFALLYCLAGIPAGRLADKVDRRKMIAVGCLVWTIATASCAFANSFWTLLACRLLVGLGEATLLPAAVSMISSYFPVHRRGFANGIWFSGASAGKAVSFIGGGALLAAITVAGGWTIAGHTFAPWQSLFVAAALPGFLIAGLAWGLREPPRVANKTKEEGSARDLWRHVGGHKAAFSLQMTSNICIICITHIFATWAPSFFYRKFHLEVSQAAMIVGVVALVAGPVAGSLGGLIVDGIVRRGTGTGALIVVMAVLALIVPPVLLAFAFTDILIVSILAFLVAQALAYVAGPQSYVALQMMIPLRHHGFVSAINLAVTSLFAMGIGPMVIGLFSDTVFSGSSNSLGLSVALTIALLAAGGLAAGLLGRRYAGPVIAKVTAENLAR